MSVSFRYVSTPEGVKTEPCNQSELIRRCTSLVGETDALLELMAAGQEQLAALEMRVKRIEMKLASCR